MTNTVDPRRDQPASLSPAGGGYLVALVLLVFLIPRLFVASPVCFLALDEAKYLALARAFPAHTLFNNQFYVVHPPLFPAFIRLFSLIVSDHAAGLLISLFAALASFATLVRLFRTLGKGWHWIAVALIPLAASPLHIPTSRVIYKDSLFFALFLISLFYYLRALLAGGRASYLLSGLAAVLCGLTSDLAAYLYPAFLLAGILLSRKGRGGGAAWAPPLFLLALQGAWIGLRWRIFSRNELYPAGVDGLIERVGEWSVRSLLAPRYLPETVRLFDFRLDLSRLGLHGNVYPLEGLGGLPPIIYGVFYAFCAVSAVASVVVAVRERRKSAGLFFAGLLAVCALPVLLHPEPRFLLPILLPLGYLFAEGVERLAGKRMRAAAPVLIVPLLIAALSWLEGHRRFVLAVRKEVESSRTAAYLETLPEGGIMAQVGYPPELAYLTGRRVVALPLEPADLDRFIARYGIRYLVYGQRYWAPVDPRFARSVWCWETIRHIRAHPEKYPLLRTVEESSGPGERPDRVFIHTTVISNQ